MNKKRYLIIVLLLFFISVNNISASCYKITDSNGITTYNISNMGPFKEGTTVNEVDESYCNGSSDSDQTPKVACGNVSGIPERIPKITSKMVSIVEVAVPVLMIIFGVIDFVRGMTDGKIDNISERRKIFIKRIITGLLVFFTIAIVKFLISVVSDSVSSANVSKCIDCFLSNDCSKSNETTENTKKVKSGTATTSKQKSDLSSKAENNQSSKQTTNKTNTSNDSSSNNSDNSSSNSDIKSKTMFVGDSRTVQMCYNLASVNSRRCMFSENKSKGYEYDGVLYIGEGSMGYKWFSTTAVNGVNNLKGSNPYNIVILMGVNDVGSSAGASSAKKYFDKVSTLAKGDWKNDNIIFVSVNPVKSTGKHYAKQDQVNKFNEVMKSSISQSNISNLKYCNTATSLTQSDVMSGGDGLHYSKSVYKKIYDRIKSDCLK